MKNLKNIAKMFGFAKKTQQTNYLTPEKNKQTHSLKPEKPKINGPRQKPNYEAVVKHYQDNLKALHQDKNELYYIVKTLNHNNNVYIAINNLKLIMSQTNNQPELYSFAILQLQTLCTSEQKDLAQRIQNFANEFEDEIQTNDKNPNSKAQWLIQTRIPKLIDDLNQLFKDRRKNILISNYEKQIHNLLRQPHNDVIKEFFAEGPKNYLLNHILSDEKNNVDIIGNIKNAQTQLMHNFNQYNPNLQSAIIMTSLIDWAIPLFYEFTSDNTIYWGVNETKRYSFTGDYLYQTLPQLMQYENLKLNTNKVQNKIAQILYIYHNERNDVNAKMPVKYCTNELIDVLLKSH